MHSVTISQIPSQFIMSPERAWVACRSTLLNTGYLQFSGCGRIIKDPKRTNPWTSGKAALAPSSPIPKQCLLHPCSGQEVEPRQPRVHVCHGPNSRPKLHSGRQPEFFTALELMVFRVQPGSLCSHRSPHYRWGFTGGDKTISEQQHMDLCVVSSTCRSMGHPASMQFAYICLIFSRGRWDLS